MNSQSCRSIIASWSTYFVNKPRRFRISLLLINISLYSSAVSGQGPKAEQPDITAPSTVIKIGSLMPDAILEMYGHSGKTSRISDYRGKALILDFWATWCRPCVRALPKLDSVQKANKKDLNILLVTREDKHVVNNFLKLIQQNISIDIPSVVNDSCLLRLFNIRSLPQQVWIDKNGYVQAITYAEHLTAANLRDLINGRKPQVPLKKGTLRGKLPIAGRPLFSQDAAKPEDSSIISYSLLTKHNEAFASAIGGNGPGQQSWGAAKTKLLFTNMPPVTLYSIAYAPLLGDDFFALDKRIIFNTRDSLKYTYPANISNMEAQEWNVSNTYCYDIMVPLQDTSRIIEIMRNDMNRYFPLQPSIETRPHKCLQLSVLNEKIPFTTKGGKSSRVFSEYYIKYENVPFRQLITDLNLLLESRITLLSDIPYKGNIDLELKGDLTDIEELSRALAKLNIASVPLLKDIKYLILSDR